MSSPPSTGRFLAVVALLVTACTRHEEPRANGTISSSGLPPLNTADGGEQPQLPDAAASSTLPDGGQQPGPEVAADAPAAPDLAADLAPLPPDAGVDRTPADAPLCSATMATAKPLPVDILVLLDRSDSMNSLITSTPGDGGFTFLTRWESMSQALTNFVMSPAAAGLSVGLAYFPSTLGISCNVTDYSTPAVPIDVLPGVATAFTASINATRPGGGTPTLPAMQGAIAYAKQREAMLGRRTAIALATDGIPNDCSSTIQAVADAASMAAAQGIYTFVIGVGSSMAAFSTFATAGGTKTAFQVENATPTELAMAFKSIQTQAAGLACTFMVPPPPPGEMLDPFKVSVTFTPTANPTQSFGIGIVPGRGDCGPMGGWYVDDLNNPTKLTLCDASCQKVNSTGEGSLSVLFGCVAK
jgi:hypothetical protein